MKALVISKPKSFTKEKITPDKLKESKRLLQKYIDEGIVEQAYAIIGGGSAYIVNVKSLDELEQGLQKNELMKYSDVDIATLEERTD